MKAKSDDCIEFMIEHDKENGSVLEVSVSIGKSNSVTIQKERVTDYLMIIQKYLDKIKKGEYNIHFRNKKEILEFT